MAVVCKLVESDDCIDNFLLRKSRAIKCVLQACRVVYSFCCLNSNRADIVINIQLRFIWIEAMRFVVSESGLNWTVFCVASSARCPLKNLLTRKSVEVIRTLAAFFVVQPSENQFQFLCIPRERIHWRLPPAESRFNHCVKMDESSGDQCTRLMR